MFGIGGMPKWLFQIASQLKDEFDFYFIATHSSYIRPEYQQVARVAVLPFNKWRIAAYLAFHRIDIAQVANMVRYKKAAQLGRVPIIIERTDGLRGGVALNSKSGLDAVICSTTSVANQVREIIAPEKVHIIYNGFDLSTYDNQLPERFGYADTDIIIGRTSRLAAGKNISLLIKAVIELRMDPEFEHVRLVICGGNNTQRGAPLMMDQLMLEASPLKDSVVFTGEVFDTRAITLGYDIATCTSNSNNEGIPNSLIEAMAAGKPIVATRVDDIPELVEHGKSGYLVAENELVELVTVLKKFSIDADIRKNFGRTGKEKIQRDFEIGTQVEKYLKLYKMLLSS
jgi:glycosyltransferase involved in cell wall biosynthesis